MPLHGYYCGRQSDIFQTSTSQFIVMIEVVDSQQVTQNRAKLDIQYLQVIDFIGVIFYEKSTIKTITS